ncbi:MAG: FecR domain-containing protein [Paludibacter sp.]|nr:FecR domain-containing protein [Paludibacter sp.]
MFTENQLNTLFAKLFSGIINSEEKAILRTWLNESVQNKEYYLNLKNIWQVAHPAFLPSSINVLDAEKKLKAKIKSNKKKPLPIFVLIQRVAAILLIPTMITLGFYMDKDRYRGSTIAFQEVSAPFGTSSKINLSDGSIVWLNSGSKLKYPVTFTSNERKVYLSGEAFFEVETDKDHPFIVETEQTKIQAIGTKFNVEAYTLDTITAITLLEGKVNVRIDLSNEIQLRPNQRIVYNSITNKYKLKNTDAHYWGLWKDGVLAFRAESLEDVFKRIGRTFNVEIQVKDPAVARHTYRATFEGETLDEILRLLKMTAPIEYKIIAREKQNDNVFSKQRIEVYRLK